MEFFSRKKIEGIPGAKMIPMKKLKIILILIAFYCCNIAGAQVEDTALVNRVRRQAQHMGEALLKKDFTAFAKYVYPKVIELAGGEEKMIKQMSDGATDMEAKGFQFTGITFGDLTKVVKKGNELQGLLSQTIELKVPSGKMISRSTLIAISMDHGLSWYFVDTSGKSNRTLRRILPKLSRKLKIPARPEPEIIRQ
jgi:hypothetical protein